MPKLNLKNASVADLVSMRDQIQTALSERIGGERAELQKRMDALTRLERAHVQSDGDGRKATKRAGRAPRKLETKPRKKAEPKYRGPEGDLWTGRGNAPRWLAALEATGKKRESFLIKK